MKTYRIFANWDDDAEVWVAQSDNVPGLVTEAATMNELVEKLKILVPEMLEENDEIPFEWLIKCTGID